MLSYIGLLERGCLPFPACVAATTMTDVDELEDDGLEVVSAWWSAGGGFLVVVAAGGGAFLVAPLLPAAGLCC